MSYRTATFIRVFLVFVIFTLAWYTFHLYAEIFGRLSVKPQTEDAKSINVVEEKKVRVEDPDSLIDQKKIEDADKQWDKEQNLFHPQVKISKKNPCKVSVTCKPNEFSFKIITGAANVIGPSVCFNGSIIMKNSLNNVDRGMNIALVNAKTGQSLSQRVFDLYGKDSTEVKGFLKSLKPDEVVLVTTSDDAAFKLDKEAKGMFVDIGSKHATELGFRDNWVFVGGQRLNKPSGFEQIMKNNKETNKYGDWPEAITLEGCLPRLT